MPELCGKCDGWVQYKTGPGTRVTEVYPEQCRHGHPLVVGRTLVAHQPSEKGGPPHRRVHCLACEEEGLPGSMMLFEYGE